MIQKTILTVVVVLSLIGVFSIFNKEATLGAFTSISSSDLLTQFPTTYNANLAKTIEVGTTSVASITALPNLASIGTITTGVWNGTAIPVGYGGTGTTSPTSNQVMLGNGSSGLKVVTGFGASGTVLTSQGAGSAPIWSSVSPDTSANFTWTGNHNFTGTLTHIKNLVASTTITFNAGGSPLSYVFPTTRQASSTVLTEDGSGNLRFITPQSYVLGGNSRLLFTSNSTATTTGDTVRIPANTLSTVGSINIKTMVSAVANSTYCAWDIGLGNGTATSSIGEWRTTGDNTQNGLSDIAVMATSSTSIFAVNRYNQNTWAAEGGATVNTLQQIHNVSANTASTLYISFGTKSGSGNVCGILGYSVSIDRF